MGVGVAVVLRASRAQLQLGAHLSRLDLCPHRRSAQFDDATLVVTKCCLLERGVEVHGSVAVVPWGSNLDEVRLALRLLLGVGPVVEAARIGAALTP